MIFPPKLGSRAAARLIFAVAAAGALGAGCAKTEAVTVKAVAPDSNRQWALNVGGAAADSLGAVAIDLAGNIAVTGTFEETVTFGETTHASVGSKDIYVGRLTSSGHYLWSKAFGSDQADQVSSLVVDRAGNSYLAGTFLASLDFGLGPLTSLGGSDIFVVKLDPSGVALWSKSFGGEGLDADARLVLDAEGDLVVAAVFSQTVVVGDKSLASSGETDVFITRLSSADGSPILTQKFGGSEAESVNGLAVAPSGLAVVGGDFSGTLPLGSSPVTSRGEADAFLLKYSANGR